MKPIMTIDELDDFEDENSEMLTESTIENNCLVVSSPENKSHGTGFLIDSDGTFLSAGHVFKNTSVEHCVYYKGNKYDYETILIEYTDNDAYSQSAQLCNDLFVGRLKNFNGGTFDSSFHLGDSSKLRIGEILFAAGYSRTCRICMDSNLVVEGAPLWFSQICFSLCSAENVLDKYAFRKDDTRLKMTNVKALDIPDINKWHGLSGGPVFQGKEIYGVLIADMFITAEYIKSKLSDSLKANS